MNGIDKVEAKMIARIRKEITKKGPLTWAAARLASSPHYTPNDAYFTNLRILKFIERGALATVELASGDSLVSLPK